MAEAIRKDRGEVWLCKGCGEIIGVWVAPSEQWPEGCLLLVSQVVDISQRYVNGTRVECACGAANWWHYRRGRAH